MKRAERRHLKDNELARAAATARQVVEERRGQLTTISAAVVVVLAAVLGYFWWSGRVSARAHTLLADALAVDDARVGPPPAAGSPVPAGLSFDTARAKNQAALTKFKIAADEYPSTDAGIFARYRQASTYMALGEAASAATTYQQVIDRAGNSLYGQMAKLGLAEAQAQTGQYEQAINTFKELAQRKDGDVPVDGVLLRLGRVYIDAGKKSDAEQTFNRLVEEFPDSPFSADARRELDQLKKT
jgi:tetratricopeptide (TPR) repeat protein